MQTQAPNGQAHQIEVRVRELAQLFNVMDPSPFHEKELDADAEEYIVGWAQELPIDEPMMLLVHLDQHPPDHDPRALIAEAVAHYFTYRAETTARRLKLMTRESWQDLGRGALFLIACMSAVQLLAYFQSASAAFLRESLLIPGWVAMWRPMELFLYERWPLKKRGRLYRILAAMPVSVRIRDAGDT